MICAALRVALSVAILLGGYGAAGDSKANAADGDHVLTLLDAGLKPVSGTLTFALQPGATAATRTVFLRRTNGADVDTSNVRLVLELTAGSATLTRQGGASAAAPFTIAAGTDEQVEITVTVPTGAKADGALVAIVGGSPEKLANVSATSPAAPAVSIAENSNGVKRTATVTDYSLFLTLTANEGGAKGVAVSVPDLTDSTSRQVPVVVAVDGGSGPIDLAPLATARVSITAQVPRPGDYTGGIVVVHDGKREDPVPLTITRTQVPPTVEILTFTPTGEPRPGHVVLEAVVHESSGSPVALDAPTVLPLGRKNGDTRTGPSFSSADVKVERLAAEGGAAKEVGDTLVLSGGETATLRMTITDLKKPGDYGARLRLSTSGGTAVTSDTSFLLRRSWWLAAIVILIGVAISVVIREVVMRRGAKARQGIQVGLVADDLKRLRARQHDLEPAEAAAFDVLESRVDDVYEQGDAEFASALEKVNLQVTLLGGWLRARRRLALLKPPAADQFRERVDSLLDHVMSSAESADALKDAAGKLPQLQTDVGTALRDQIRGEIDAQRKAATDASDYVGKAAKDAIASKVLPLLDAATEKLGQAGDLDLIEAVGTFHSARALYAGVLLQDLLDRLKEKPDGLDQQEWENLTRRLENVIADAGDDPERQLAAYRTAVGIYLTDIAAFVVGQAESRAGEIQKIPVGARTPAQVKALLLYTEAKTHAASVPTRLAGGEVALAFDEYKVSAQKLRQADSTDPALAGAPSPEPPPAPAPPPMAAVTSQGPLASADRKHRQIDASKLRKTITRTEWALIAFSAFFAVLLGLSLLYVPNDTWGSLGDIILALLWGVGLHQIAGQVQGYTGVQKTLTAPPS